MNQQSFDAHEQAYQIAHERVVREIQAGISSRIVGASFGAEAGEVQLHQLASSADIWTYTASADVRPFWRNVCQWLGVSTSAEAADILWRRMESYRRSEFEARYNT